VDEGSNSLTRILIVEDDSQTVRLLSTVIVMSRPDCFIEVVDNGDEAIVLLSQKRFDLVITDIFHEGLSGLALLSRIKKDPEFQDIRVMVVSGHALGERARDAWKRGADCVFSKPFEIEKFQRNLHRFVGHSTES
jgi:CheY-like chemotaxis protein